MNDNSNTVRIRVELDAGQLKTGGAQAIKEFAGISQQELKRLGEQVKAVTQKYHELSKSLNLSVGQLREAVKIYRQTESAAKRAADTEIREAQRASKARIREAQAAAHAQEREMTKMYRTLHKMEQDEQRRRERDASRNFKAQSAANSGGGGFGGGVGGYVVGRLAGGGGGLGGGIGAGLGAAGFSLPAIGAVIGGITLINSLIETGVGLVKKWVEVWYDYRITIERANLGLTVLLGSQKQANQFTQQLVKDLRGMGDLDSALVLSRRLINVGLAADEARMKVKELVTIATGLGSSSSEQRGFAKALSDVVTAGKLRGQEVLQFQNAGLNIQKAVADSLGISPAQVQKLQKEGKVTARMVLDAISKEAARYGSVKEQALLLPDVSINRIQQQMGRLGDKFFGTLGEGISRRLKEIADFLENQEEIPRALEGLGERLVALAGDIGGRMAYALGSGFAKFRFEDLAIIALGGFVQGFSESRQRKFTPKFSDGTPIPEGFVQTDPKTGKPLNKFDPNVIPYVAKKPTKETDSDGSGGKGKRSFAEKLSDRIRRLTNERNAFVGGKNFDQKFEAEGLERQIRTYENIRNLQYKLGLDFNSKLPAEVEAAKILEESLKSQERVYDAVKAAQQEVQKGAEDLAIAIQTQLLPIVDSETRFQTAYTNSLRERRNEEEQLTADLKLSTQKRIDAMTDEAEKARRLENARKRAGISTLSEADSAESSAALAAERRRIAEGGGVLYGKEVFGESDGGLTATTQAIDLGIARAKTLKDLASEEVDNSVTGLRDNIEKLTEVERRYATESETTTRRSLRAKESLVLMQKELREGSEAAAVEAIKLSRQLAELNDPGSARARLKVEEAENEVLRTQITAKEQIVQLETELARASEGSADRYRIAWLEAIKEVADADEEATKSQIRSQVQIAQQTEFNANRARAAVLDHISQTKGLTEIFSDSFIRVTDGIGDSIGRLLDRTTSKLGAFGKAVSGIATDLLKMITNRLMMRLLDALLGNGGAAGGAAVGGGGGGGGIGSAIGGIGSILFGGGGAGGGGGGLFRTPPFSNNLFQGGGAGGLSPFTASGSFLNLGGSNIGSLDTISGRAASLGNIPGLIFSNSGRAGGAAGSLGKLSLSGIGKALGAAAPFLGFSLGAGVGGQSTLGSLFGGVGGALVGGFGAASAGLLGTGAAAGLLSNPFTAIIGAGLLVGGFFLGRAKQRRKDESTADSYWVEYKDRVIELTNAVKANRMDGDEALSEAMSARSTAIEKINTIKTKSVRESRLKNQIGDVDRLFLEPLKRAVEEQKTRKNLDSKLIPEFSSGGVIPGQFGEARYVLAHGRELVINPQQQTPALMAAAAEAGVPGVRGSGGGASAGSPIYVEVRLGTETQNQLFVNGGKSDAGYSVIVQQTNRGRKNEDIRF